MKRPPGPPRAVAAHLWWLSLGERRHQVVGLFGLDRLFPWPPRALLGSHTDPAAGALSDHPPVIGDIRVTPLPAAQERGGTS